MKGDEKAPDYRGFYSFEAIKMIKWMHEETNTTKRAKLYRTACRLEYRFRKHHGIGEDGKWMSGLRAFPLSPKPDVIPPRGGTAISK